MEPIIDAYCKTHYRFSNQARPYRRNAGTGPVDHILALALHFLVHVHLQVVLVCVRVGVLLLVELLPLRLLELLLLRLLELLLVRVVELLLLLLLLLLSVVLLVRQQLHLVQVFHPLVVAVVVVFVPAFLVFLRT